MLSENILIFDTLSCSHQWLAPVIREIFPSSKIFITDSLDDVSKWLATLTFSIALLDAGSRDNAALHLLDTIKKKDPDVTCILSALSLDKHNIFLALQSGADGYLIKEGTSQQLKTCLNRAKKGAPVLSVSVVRLMINHFHQKQILQNTHKLTCRQNEILTLIAKGMQNKEIAKALNLSIYTVMDHVKHLYDKLSVSSRAEAALKAQQLGLI
ncbi:MAG: response regulator transcription factor [Gammaproteobacteria bacterium]|nr:response regulator transcription factor [Gammaproteobacteria bacterium]